MSETDYALARIAGAIARFEDQTANDVDTDNIGGMTAAVILSGDLFWTRGFGWADVERETPATAETIYRVGSVAKSFTAVLLLQLHEERVLDLDYPVEAHFPEIGDLAGYTEQSPITFRQLASHTAGLAREPDLEDAATGPIDEWESKVLGSISRTPFECAPGTRYSYSNIGYGILGLAISRAAGATFIDLVGDLILSPLGMNQSGFYPTNEMWSNLATGNARPWGVVDTTIPFEEHSGRGYKVPNGGIYSSVADLARFIADQVGLSPGPILSPVSLSQMHSMQTPGSDGSGYGLGFKLRTGPRGRRMVGHGGSVAGYNAYIDFDPRSGAGIVLMRNYNGGAANLERCGANLLDEIVATT